MQATTSNIRNAAVAGQFYPGAAIRLKDAVKSLIGPGPPEPALGAMVPHAGYVYSGSVAGKVYGSVALPDVFVILGPNHTGLGPAAAVMSDGVWRLPAGDAKVDIKLAAAIQAKSSALESDAAAHLYEHSIEVQLPFLQYLAGEVLFVPITLMINDAERCREIGAAIAAAIAADNRKVLVIASSDMTHYESQEMAQKKDTLALERILGLDPEGLLETVRSNHITMCGSAPVAAMLFACKQLGASDARLIGYANSGDVNGDYSQVVGYAGVTVS